MDELFIQPIQVKTMESGIESISANGGQVSGKGGAETFKSAFREAIDNVTSTENDLVNKQYLLATGRCTLCDGGVFTGTARSGHVGVAAEQSNGIL